MLFGGGHRDGFLPDGADRNMNAVRSRDVAGFIIGYWGRSRRLVAGAFATMVAATACDIFLPVLAGTLLDSLVDVSAERRPAQLHSAVMADRKCVALGTSVSVRVALGCRRNM